METLLIRYKKIVSNGCGRSGRLIAKACKNLGRICHLWIYLSVVSFSIYDLNRTCGTHFGDTNDPASMFLTPVEESLRINSSFVSSPNPLASFCKPSRGPTSTTRTSLAALGVVVEKLRRAHKRPSLKARSACTFMAVHLHAVARDRGALGPSYT